MWNNLFLILILLSSCTINHSYINKAKQLCSEVKDDKQYMICLRQNYNEHLPANLKYAINDQLCYYQALYKYDHNLSLSAQLKNDTNLADDLVLIKRKPQYKPIYVDKLHQNCLKQEPFMN